ncbi:heme peroxidase [Mycena olivaceomarginata]|nr:heme peroxidase [Mycena olivaceomarginata]
MLVWTFSGALEAQGLPNGTADESMIWDLTEVLRTENNGLQNIVSILSPLPAHINAFIGRPPPLNVAPNGLLPSPDNSVPTLITDMGFTVRDLTALVSAHSTGKQRFVDPTVANSSFDSTVDIWDARFYAETAAPTTPPDVLKLHSDVNFSHNASTFHEFHRFINNQEDWGQDITTLTNCTELMPASINHMTISGTVDPTLLEAAIQKYRAPWIS